MKQNMEESELVAYLSGNAGRDESAAVEAWYAESEENKQQLRELYGLLIIGHNELVKNINVEASLVALKERIEEERRVVCSPRRPARRILGWSIAAAVIAGLFIYCGSLLGSADKFSSRPFAVSTQLGERAHLYLPDGSQVWLNSCSSIEYSTSFFNRARKVRMSGEAYFEVKKDNSSFTVSSHGLDTHVLGTRFNVRANSDDEQVTVTLFEGSVLATSEQTPEGMKLRPGQQLTYNTRTGNLNLLECTGHSDDYIAWIDGKLHFEQATLERIASELEHYYNVKISFADNALRDEKFSCDFETADNIHQILSTLELTHKFGYWIKGQDIVLYSKLE